jgi:hypothetical protein
VDRGAADIVGRRLRLTDGGDQTLEGK